MDHEKAKQISSQLGVGLCVFASAYFFLTASYAVLNAADYMTDLPRILRYVVGPLAIAFGLVWAGFRQKPETRLTVGVSAVSVLVALFIFEAVLTMQSLSAVMGLGGQSVNPQDTLRFQRAIPPSYTLKSLNRALGISEPEDVVLGGVAGADVLLCTRAGVPVAYTADRFGFRNSEALYEQPVEVLVLGDSFAEGICLPDGEDIVSNIRRFYPATLNAGTRGAGPLFELAILRRFGPKLAPQKTLMLFFEGNDWQNLQSEQAGSGALSKFLDLTTPVGQMRADPDQAEAIAAITAGWWRDHHNGSFISRRAWFRNFIALQQTSGVLGLHYPKGFPEQPVYNDVLRTARAVVADWGGDISVVYVPQVDRFIGLFSNAVAYDGLRDRVREATRAAGVGFIDLTEPMMATADPRSYYAEDSHLSAAGATFAAQVIHDALGAITQHARANGAGAMAKTATHLKAPSEPKDH